MIAMTIVVVVLVVVVVEIMIIIMITIIIVITIRHLPFSRARPPRRFCFHESSSLSRESSEPKTAGRNGRDPTLYIYIYIYIWALSYPPP